MASNGWSLFLQFETNLASNRRVKGILILASNRKVKDILILSIFYISMDLSTNYFAHFSGC